MGKKEKECREMLSEAVNTGQADFNTELPIRHL